METTKKSQKDNFGFLVDAGLAIEKLRVAAQIRNTHLGLQGRTCKETKELLARISDLENYVDERVAEMVKNHPAYSWFSKVKGIGKENIAKVVGLIDITKANTISSLWKFAGYAVKNGKAPKRQKGEKLSYNSQLRSMCWRLGSFLMRSRGKFKDYYDREKKKYIQKYEAQGIKIMPANKIKNSNGKRPEETGAISEGHIHNMALRKMIKLFLACLWLKWREAEGLSMRAPYSHEYQGHTTLISPWDMIDR